MTLQKRLEVLQEQYDSMIKYRALCNGMNCTINYSSTDFEREGELLKKIEQTKEWINKKKLIETPEELFNKIEAYNGSKYRTETLSKEEFFNKSFNTPDDWKSEIRNGNLNLIK